MSAKSEKASLIATLNQKQHLVARVQDGLLLLARFAVLSRLASSSAKAVAPARLRCIQTLPSTPVARSATATH